MPSSKRFKYPPLVEVAFEINFLPKLRLIDILADFQDSIVNKYPEIGEEDLFPLHIGAPNSDSMLKFRQRFIFENKNHTRLLRISRQNFNFVERKYSSFNVFNKELKHLWSLFKNKIGNLSITRVGLRYINNVRIPFKGNRLETDKYVHPYYSLTKLNPKEINTIFVDSRIDRNDFQLNIRSGIRGTELIDDKKFGMYLLDYDCYKEGSNLPTSTVTELSKFHNIIESQFLNDIKDRYIMYMNEGEWK